MRDFDYNSTPPSLKSDGVINLLLALREFKGKQVMLRATKPQLLDSLMEQAALASTEASNRIEGIVTTKARMKELMGQMADPHSRNEEEIAGYRDVLSTIHEQHEHIAVTPTVILQLHRNLMRHTSYSFGGRWKDVDNQIVAHASDGRTYVRFTPTPAAATPQAMDKLCQTYRQALAAGQADPLLLSARFVFDFVSIHPFSDGNGRMSRLLTVLLLEKCGYLVPRYVSIEKLIEQNKELYYEALAASSTNWETGSNDEEPFARYLLGTIVAAYRELFERVDAAAGGASKSQRVASVFEYAIGKITKDDIREHCPDASDSTIERELKRMLDDGKIRKVGGGRSTGYVKLWD